MISSKTCVFSFDPASEGLYFIWCDSDALIIIPNRTNKLPYHHVIICE